MKDLRNLLIDCRIELRKLIQGFNNSELCTRLDAAVHGIDHTIIELHQAAPTPQEAKTATSTQVALAWQMAVRDLKFSDPALYDTLKNKVMARLETKTLVDQTTELHQLEDTVAALIAQQDAAEYGLQALVAERDMLLEALATAAPQLDNNGGRMAVAMARIEWLKAQTPEALHTTALEQDNPMLTTEILQAVVAGTRMFTDAQREWCVGEAMVLSDFQITPVELLARGDSEIARIILKSK